MTATNSTKLSAKQEAFCLAYIETGNASEAYRRSYNVSPKTKTSTVNRKAHDVLSNGNVAARIEATRAKAAKRNEVTVDSLVAELEQARSLALQEKQSSAAVSATMGKAKLLGFLIDKSEVSGKDGGPIKVENSTDELVSRIARLASRAGENGGTRRDH